MRPMGTVRAALQSQAATAAARTLRDILASIPLQLPLLLMALALAVFRTSDQGIVVAALEPSHHPVAAPVVAFFVTAFLVGCWMLTAWSPAWRRSRAFRPSPSSVCVSTALFCALLLYSLPSWATALGALFAIGSALALWFGRHVMSAIAVLSILFVKVMTRMATPGTVAEAAGVEKGPFYSEHAVWMVLLLFYPFALLLAGLYGVTSHLEWFVGLGPLVTAYAGLGAVCIAVQMLLVVIPSAFGSLCFALVPVAILAACLAWQSPLTDRENPLLEHRREDRVSEMAPVRSSGASPTTPRYVISAEGGGIRAAYWTAMLLQDVAERRGEAFRSEVELLSGVSGGSLGLATWIAAQELRPELRRSAIERFLSQDFLTPLIAGLLFVDVPRLVLPTWVLNRHRGDYFEALLAERWKLVSGSDFFYRRMSTIRLKDSPAAIFFNATDALTGEFIALGSHQALPVPGATLPNKLNEQVQGHFIHVRVAQAVHASARFFYLSPHPDLMLDASKFAGLLTPPASVQRVTDKARAAVLVDGGYFDNSGLGPVIQYLAQNPTAAPHLQIIHIVNDQRRACASSPTSAACRAWAETKLREAQSPAIWAWITRPMEAIFAVRGEHALQRINELGRARDRMQCLQLPPPGRTTSEAVPARGASGVAMADVEPTTRALQEDAALAAATLARKSPIALGWVLAPQDIQEINAASAEVARAASGSQKQAASCR